jgi:hypothetical protein
MSATAEYMRGIGGMTVIARNILRELTGSLSS